MNLKTPKLEIEILPRESDGSWQVAAPISSVRIGETSRELVKRKQAVDYLRCLTVYVGKTEKECRKWLDRHRPVLLKLGIPYEVGSS
jgi:hypothetical protein